MSTDRNLTLYLLNTSEKQLTKQEIHYRKDLKEFVFTYWQTSIYEVENFREHRTDSVGVNCAL
jgi:hypothetical protein